MRIKDMLNGIRILLPPVETELKDVDFLIVILGIALVIIIALLAIDTDREKKRNKAVKISVTMIFIVMCGLSYYIFAYRNETKNYELIKAEYINNVNTEDNKLDCFSKIANGEIAKDKETNEEKLVEILINPRVANADNEVQYQLEAKRSKDFKTVIWALPEITVDKYLDYMKKFAENQGGKFVLEEKKIGERSVKLLVPENSPAKNETEFNKLLAGYMIQNIDATKINVFKKENTSSLWGV